MKGEVEKMGVRFKKNMGKMGEYKLVQEVISQYGKQLKSRDERYFDVA